MFPSWRKTSGGGGELEEDWGVFGSMEKEWSMEIPAES